MAVVVCMTRCVGNLTERSDSITVKNCWFLDDVNVSVQLMEAFLEEACFLTGHSHINLLTTIGVVWRSGDRPHVLFPYMAKGNLFHVVSRTELVGILVSI